MVKYKLVSFSNLVHDLIVKNLVEKKGYDSKLLDSKYNSKWCQKGLVLDKRRGHILRIGSEYQILKACHGSRFLSREEIGDNYGSSRVYGPLKDTLVHYIEKGSSWETSPFLILKDFFSTPYASLFVDIVDLVGPRDDYSEICTDIYDVLVMMYHRRAMLEGTGGFFSTFEKDPSRYLYPASEGQKKWLKSLRREGIKLFLLTSSNSDFANLLMESTFGTEEEWKSYFDIIISYAKKPHFFTSQNPFYEVNANHGDGSVVRSASEMSFNTTYCKGNQRDLQDFFSRTLQEEKRNEIEEEKRNEIQEEKRNGVLTGKKVEGRNARVLYFGDSVFDDIYAPSTVGWDTAVVLEELDEDSRSELETHYWGSFFHDTESDAKNSNLEKNSDSSDPEGGKDATTRTLFFDIIKSKAVLAVPSIQVIADLDPEVTLVRDPTKEEVLTWRGLPSLVSTCSSQKNLFCRRTRKN